MCNESRPTGHADHTRARRHPAAVLAALVGVVALWPGPAAAQPALPEGDTGIAARYPGDVGIGADEAVVFADDFESAQSIADLEDEWDSLINPAHLSIVAGPDNHHAGNQALLATIPRQSMPLSTGIARTLPDRHDTLFVRWYTKFDSGWFVPDGSVHNGATVSAQYFVDGRATPGEPADGRNKFLISYENENSVGDAPGHMNVYIYWPEQGDRWGDHFFPSGTVLPFSVARSGAATFGDSFLSRPDFSPLTNRWYAYELMVRANTPGVRDGRVAMWLDGALIADFPNLRLRDVEDLQIDRVDLGLYIADNSARANSKWYDDVVVATSYIGPMVSSRSAVYVPSASK